MGHSFCNHAKHKVEFITEEYKKMDDAYREVCIMFNESSKTTEPSEFFTQFTQFISEWKVSVLLGVNKLILIAIILNKTVEFF